MVVKFKNTNAHNLSMNNKNAKYVLFAIAFIFLISHVFYSLSGQLSYGNIFRKRPDSNLTISPRPSGCIVAGCSGELCVDKIENAKNPILSICLYKKEYACLKLAKCERQKNGKCGWTYNQKYYQCLKNLNDVKNNS
ncbi:MAG: hypothetical protein N3E37_02200 [Candidatus Micrarchaeota archaeon]|nr:hypothetical protein [Candidatus Micrarchaeota archaeon]